MKEFFASLAGKLVLAGLLLAVIVFGVTQCQNARNSATESRVSRSQTGAALDSGADAVGAVGAVSGRNSATDKITMENDDAIDTAQGAHDPVNPAVRDAGLGSVCRRAAYHSDPKCVRFTPAARVAKPGAGSAPPRR